MKVLISYDIDQGHNNMKKLLIDAGFQDQWATEDNEVHNLPNTTLWHPNLKGPDQAKDIFFLAIAEVAEYVTVDRFIAAEMGELVSGMKGDPHT